MLRFRSCAAIRCCRHSRPLRLPNRCIQAVQRPTRLCFLGERPAPALPTSTATWTFDGTRWTPVSVSRPPPARYQAMMATLGSEVVRLCTNNPRSAAFSVQPVGYSCRRVVRRGWWPRKSRRHAALWAALADAFGRTAWQCTDGTRKQALARVLAPKSSLRCLRRSGV